MKLIVFACPHCAAALDQPRQRDVIITCPTCRRQLRLEPGGLLPQPVTYAAPADAPPDQVAQWRPFWIVRAAVDIEYRPTQRARDGEAEASRTLWSQPRRFYIPADELSFGRLRGVALKLLESQPALTPLAEPPATALLPAAALTAGDASQIVDLLVVAVETRRRDVLKSLKYTLNAEEPELWALPMAENRLLL